MSCLHEHEHGHGGHSHDHGEHDHSHDLEPALPSNLYSQIKFEDITTLNETESRSGAAVVKKTWDERLIDRPVLESDADEQLLMHIPFAGSCKLYSILVRSSDSYSCPNKVKLFRNRDDLDFSAATDLKPTQTVEIPRTNEIAEIPLNRALWNTTTSITLFVEDNHSGGEEDMTRIYYIGFRGDFMALNREPVTVLYEAAANPKDHKVIQGLEKTGSHSLGQ